MSWTCADCLYLTFGANFMHDPCTVAHEVRIPWLDRKIPILTIWHVDPERDGSDDSCDWFGGKHLDPVKLEEIRRDFRFSGRESDHGMSWFADGPYSPDLLGTGICMFRIAANVHFGHWSRRANRFLNDNVFEILRFIDNECDSINADIRRAAEATGDDRIEILNRLAYVVYAWIVRKDRPWWKHPRWHFWHWRFQFHPWQDLKRRWWDKCCVCGKRGFREPAIGNWDGDKIWHASCDHKVSHGPAQASSA